jgi:hypothetical protein
LEVIYVLATQNDRLSLVSITEKPCNIAISGDEEEVLDIAVQHAIKSHGHDDTPGLPGTVALDAA